MDPGIFLRVDNIPPTPNSMPEGKDAGKYKITHRLLLALIFQNKNIW